MQSHDADAAAARLGEGKLDQVRGEAATAIFGLDIDVEQIATRAGLRIQRMRRPVEEEETRAGDDIAVVFTEPAEILAIGNSLRNPGLVRLGHELEALIVAAARVYEHAATVVRD
jgi:hypothetical protein